MSLHSATPSAGSVDAKWTGLLVQTIKSAEKFAGFKNSVCIPTQERGNEEDLDEFIPDQHEESNVEQEPTKEPTTRPNRNDVESAHQNNNQSHSTRTPELKPKKRGVRRNISHIPYSELKPRKAPVQKNIRNLSYSELWRRKKDASNNKDDFL